MKSPVSKTFHPDRACDCERLGLDAADECVHDDPCWESEAAYLRSPEWAARNPQAVVYDGSFTLAWLANDERVSSAGDGTGAAIVSGPWGDRRLNIGDRFTPRALNTADPQGSAPGSDSASEGGPNE